MFNKIYVISLKRRQDRRSAVSENIKSSKINSLFGGIDVEFIDAVDGRDLTFSKLEEFGASPLKEFRHTASRRFLTWGDVACSLSHLEVWKKIILDAQPALILEDDVVFDNNFLEKINKISLDASTLDYDIFYLGRKKVSRDEEEVVVPGIVKPKFSWWTSSYIITPKCAKEFTESNFKQNLIPIDDWLNITWGDYPTKDIYDYFDVRKNFAALALEQNLISQTDASFLTSDTEKSDIINHFTAPVDVVGKRFIALSIATEDNEPLRRLSDSYEYYGVPYKILGLGSDWNGGNMAKGPGGAQKIRHLRDELRSIPDRENLIIMVTDGYDVIVTASPHEIVDRFLSKRCRILFSAEKICWPDPSLADSFRNSTGSNYCYLNSGTFIGYADDILSLVSRFTGSDNDDDQLFYTQQYLKSLHAVDDPISSLTKHGWAIDNECEIFQCLAAAEGDTTIDFWSASVKNTETNSSPIVIHGNGPENTKVFFNTMCNFIGGTRLRTFGDIRQIPSKSGTDNSLFMSLFFSEKNTSYDEFCDSINKFSYPRKNINLNIFCYAKDIQKISHRLSEANYTSVSWNVIDAADAPTRDLALQLFLDSECSHYFSIDNDIVIRHKDIIEDLLAEEKGIIAPMITRESETGWSNMWMAIDANGWYARSDYYKPTIQYRSTGVFNVPYVRGCYLISREHAAKMKGFFTKRFDPDRGSDMALCENIRSSNMFMYVTNKDYYGKMLIPQTTRYDFPISSDTPILNYSSDPVAWEKKYLDPEIMTGNVTLDLIESEIYGFQLFNESFCNEIIELSENINNWTRNRHDFYPTHDMLLQDLRLNEIYHDVIRRRVLPIVEAVWHWPHSRDKLVTENFIVKYEKSGQPGLDLHTDLSIFSIVVCLNDSFEGGGTRFPKQGVDCIKGPPGFAIMNPARLTHPHGANNVTDGTRYVIVSFCN